MANKEKYAGEAALQTVINETKKLARPEVAVGTITPTDENITLFVNEEEEGSSPNDFYTKEEANQNFYTKSQIDQSLYTKSEIDKGFYTKTQTNQNFYTKAETGQNFYTKGEVDSIKTNLTKDINAAKSWILKEKGYADQLSSKTINIGDWDSGVFLVYCRTQANPECASWIGNMTGGYCPGIKQLGSSSSYIKCEMIYYNEMTITSTQAGCGAVLYNIWFLPFSGVAI